MKIRHRYLFLVLEAYLPRYFNGAKDIMSKSEDLKFVGRPMNKPGVSYKVRNMIAKNMTNEIEFYNIVRQRLFRQFITLE